MPSADELAEAVERIRQLGVLNVRQRNEQFLAPLSPVAAAALEATLASGQIEPLNLFRAQALAHG